MAQLSRGDRQVLWIIGLAVAARLATAAAMGLGTDESYSVAIARDLHLSYFDHPPLHQWIAHAAGQAFGYGRWVRLPFVALFAGSSWLMYRLTARLFGQDAGVWAVLALNLSAFFTLAVGDWVLPDGPLVFCELAAAATLARQFFPLPGETEAAWRLWPLAGFWLGLAALSKYQAAPVAAGFALFVLSIPAGRRGLTHPAPYVGVLVAMAVASPVLLWNAQHDWVSFAFQGARGAPHRLTPLGPLESLAGQMALLLPWIAIPLIWAGVGAARRGCESPRTWFCLMAGAPTLLLFTLLPMLGAKGLPHWPMPGWLMLFPVLGQRLAQSRSQGRRWPRRWASSSAAVLAVLWIVAASDAATAWLKDALPRAFPKTDPTYEAIDWKRLRTDLDRRGLLKPGMFVVAAEWNEAGKIDQAVGDAAPVLVFSPDPREYAFRANSATFIGHDALIIGRGPTITQEWDRLRPHFATLTPLSGFSVGRGDKAEIPLTVILGRDLLTPYPPPVWARPRP
jgi:4-amino-4-deoxy-L-arabinose transferase-like glycosyltransferase